MSATARPGVEIRDDVMYQITTEAATAARAANLSVLPGLNDNDCLVTHDVLRALSETGWMLVEVTQTPYNGVLTARLVRSPEGEEDEEEVIASPVSPVTRRPFTHEEYEARREAIGALPASDCQCIRCNRKRNDLAELEAEAKERGVLPPPPPPLVTYAWTTSVSANATLKRAAEIIERILTPHVKKKIVVHSSAFYTNDIGKPVSNDAFHVFFGHPSPNGSLSSVENCTTANPIIMFGTPTEEIARGFTKHATVWLSGLPIITPEGDEVGAVDPAGQRLHVYTHAIYTGSDNEMKVLECIMTAAVSIMSEPEKHKRTTTRETYMRFCTNRIEKEINALESRAQKLTEEIAAVQRSFIDKTQESALISRRLALLATDKPGETERFATEFDALKTSFPDVTNTIIIGKTVIIETRTMTVVDPRSNTEHELGRFQIMINFDNGNIRLINLDRTVKAFSDEMQAPHVFADGRPCLGTIESIVPQLIARMDVPTMTQVMLSYLNSVNTNDPAGAHVNKWPVVGGPKTEHERPPNHGRVSS